MEYTTEELNMAVHLWLQLVSMRGVSGSTQSYYTHSSVHLSPEVTGHQQGNAYRMPNGKEIRALILSDGETTPYPGAEDDSSNPWNQSDELDPIELTLISCGDYHGSDYDSANNRALDGHPGVTVSYPGTGGMGSVESVSTVRVGEMSTFANAQGAEPSTAEALEWLAALVKTLYSLDDCPVLDDEKHAEYVNELAEEAWGNYLRSDIESELATLDPSGEFSDWSDVTLDDPRDTDDVFRVAYFEFEDNEWTCESATSVVNGQHSRAVRYAAAKAFGWPVSEDYDPPFCDQGHDDRETCPACINRCRLCPFVGTDDTGDALRTHVETDHVIGRNDCENCGRPSGH